MTAEATSPEQWNRSFSGPPDLCGDARLGESPVPLRRWRGTAALMEQPVLDHHYLVLHLGGPKRIERRDGARTLKALAGDQSISLVPAGESYSWDTRGPIGFAHVYFRPDAIDRVITEDFDRDAGAVALSGCVGRRLPLISALVNGMINQLHASVVCSRLALSSLVHSLTVQLLMECSTLPSVDSAAPHAIAPRRLRRILDYIDANLSRDIALDDLAAVAGSSRFHFSRAFRKATGSSPYQYVIRRRIELARSLLLDDIPIAQVAVRCGFHSQAQLGAMFRHVLGTSPGQFRRGH